MEDSEDLAPESDSSYEAGSECSSQEDGVVGIDHKRAVRSSIQNSRKDHEAIAQHIEQFTPEDSSSTSSSSSESDDPEEFTAPHATEETPVSFPNLGYPNPLHAAQNHITLNVFYQPPAVKREPIGEPVDSSADTVKSEPVTFKIVTRNNYNSTVTAISINLGQYVERPPFEESDTLGRRFLDTQDENSKPGLKVDVYKNGSLLYDQQLPLRADSAVQLHRREGVTTGPGLTQPMSHGRGSSSSEDENMLSPQAYLEDSDDDVAEIGQSNLACGDSEPSGHLRSDGKENSSQPKATPILEDSTTNSSAPSEFEEQELSLFVEQTPNTTNKARRAPLDFKARSLRFKALGIR